MLLINKSLFFADPEYLFDAKSVSPTTTIDVWAILPSSFSIGNFPNSDIASMAKIVGKGPKISVSTS